MVCLAEKRENNKHIKKYTKKIGQNISHKKTSL